MVAMADPSERNDLLSRPIILIGCGRSGSTLFSRMLDAHPDVQFRAETDFLIARVWREVWDNRFWLNFEHFMMDGPSSMRAAPVAIPAEAIDTAQQNAARGVRLLFAELMQLDPGFAAWGFKEIWNGNPAVAKVPWSVYQTVFPGARWVHLVRDPFTFVRSLALWNEEPLTGGMLKRELRHWKQVVEWSRDLEGVPSFFEIRFEDLMADPEATLAPILGSVGLTWHRNCAQALNRRVLGSPQASPYALERTLQGEEIAALVDKTKGLAGLMNDLGYTIPQRLEIQEQGEHIEKNLPGRVDLRSLTILESGFSQPDRSKLTSLRRRARKVVKRILGAATPSKGAR